MGIDVVVYKRPHEYRLAIPFGDVQVPFGDVTKGQAWMDALLCS